MIKTKTLIKISAFFSKFDEGFLIGLLFGLLVGVVAGHAVLYLSLMTPVGM